MKLVIYLTLLFIIFVLLLNFKFDENIKYYELETVKTKDINVKINTEEIKDIANGLSFEEIEWNKIKYKSYFKDERYVVQKYDKKRIFKGFGRYNKNLKITNDKVIKFVYGFVISDIYSYSEEPQRYIVTFNSFEGNFLFIHNVKDIDVYNIYSDEITTLIDMEYTFGKEYLTIDKYRLLDVKGEWFLVLGIYHDIEYEAKEFEHIHNCFIIFKYNVLNKEVVIWDSSNHNLTSFFMDRYYLNYDISVNKRYIFMSFIDGGVYAYDWWEDKIYKIYQAPAFDEFKEIVGEKLDETGPIMADVVVDPEDDYMYIGVYNLFGLKRAHKYYRIKARKLEEVLSSYSEK